MMQGRVRLFFMHYKTKLWCTHFIIGRIAGVGNFYEKYETHKLARKFEKELDIKIMALWSILL